MRSVVLAEGRKLRRPTLLLSTLATVTALTGLFTSLVFLRINSGQNTRRGASISALQLSQATGLTYGFKLVGVFSSSGFNFVATPFILSFRVSYNVGSSILSAFGINFLIV